MSCSELIMKFSLFNLFTTIAIVGLTLAWATERSRRLALPQVYLQQRQTMKSANRMIGAAIEASTFAARSKESSADQQRMLLKANLINHTIEIWRNREAVSYTLDQTHCVGMTSNAVASMLLKELSCSKPEDFWSAVSDIRKTGQSNLPEDLSEADYSGLTSYIQESIRH